MASVAAQTKKLILGTGVTAPIYRYHPAIIAQAFASLAALYPKRIFLGLGTGEAMNEVPLGLDWPPFAERAERLMEALKIIRGLWSGEFVDLRGRYFQVRNAKIYTLPAEKIPLIVSALGPKMAKMAGRYGDGLMTTGGTLGHNRDVVLKFFLEGVKESGRDPDKCPRFVEMKVAIDEDYEKAMGEVRFWSATEVPRIYDSDMSDPRELEEEGKKVSDERLARSWMISTDSEQAIKAIEETIRIGFNRICIHSCSPDEHKFVELARDSITPYLKERYGRE
jgi:coenzyme F420-dependent glucose-6-phosphate dehydrogenase